MNKKINLIETVSIWVWWMVWWWIFAVLWEAIKLWYSATPIAFLIAWFIAILTSYSYAKLSIKYPSEWWTVTFLFKGLWVNIFTKSLNLILWFSYIVTISLYALAFWSYWAIFFPKNFLDYELLKHILLTWAILFIMFINLFNAKIIAKFEFFIVLIKVFILFFIIFFWFSYINSSHFSDIANHDNFSIIVAWMIIFVAYEWFELIANSAKDVENPEKNLPKAYYISTIWVTILYILIAILTIWTLNEDVIIKTSDYALAEAAKPALWLLWFKLVWIAAILATLSAINATIYWNARLWYSLAIDRELPQYFSKKFWNDSYLWVIILGLLSILMANFIDLTSIATIASIWFLFIFSFVNLSALKIYKTIKANFYITFFSSIISLLALLILLYKTYISNFFAIIIFIIFIFIAFLFEATYWKTKDEQIAQIKRISWHFRRLLNKIIK